MPPSLLPILITAAAIAQTAGQARADEQRISVVDNWTIHFQEAQPEHTGPDGYVMRFAGQSMARTVQLPPEAATPLDSRRIIVRVDVQPVTTMRGGQPVPNDPWNRLGNVVLVLGEKPDGSADEIELMRFVTGYGGTGRFEQDVTEFAPLLHGARTLRVYLSSFSELPGWNVACELVYTDEGLGAQAPAFAAPVFNDMHVTAANQVRRATVDVPEGLDQPRLRFLSTGHATNGEGANEFVSSTHVLRIDGRTVARWRPWSEGGGDLRPLNPWSGRMTINGREVWASDFARSGWNPGTVVKPYVIPVPELTAGTHDIELMILGIRPMAPAPPDAADESGLRGHGFWSVSCSVVAEAPLAVPGDEG